MPAPNRIKMKKKISVTVFPGSEPGILARCGTVIPQEQKTATMVNKIRLIYIHRIHKIHCY